ncbi:hypothetical protein ACLOJK_002382 [Asimina triloba]
MGIFLEPEHQLPSSVGATALVFVSYLSAAKVPQAGHSSPSFCYVRPFREEEGFRLKQTDLRFALPLSPFSGLDSVESRLIGSSHPIGRFRNPRDSNFRVVSLLCSPFDLFNALDMLS